MTKKEVDELRVGIYRVFWESGGYSITSVGVTRNGGRWLAPTNWVAPTVEQDIWSGIIKVERVCG